MRFKKFLAVILCVLIFSGMFPSKVLSELSLPNFSLSTNAANNTLVYGNENGITRAEWLYDLTLVFDIQVDDLELPDNYFSDLTSTHKYYKSILKAVQFGVVDIPAGEELKPDDYVTRDFAASTLNFCLGYQLEEGAEYTYTDSENVTSPQSAQIAINREWFELIDGAFSPETLVSSNEVKTMLDDAKEVLAGQVIDENYESTYEFADDVIVLPDTLDVTEDENGVITITDCPETISKNDKFAVYFNNIPVVYTALNVSTENNITTISTKQTESEDAFADVDAQGVIDSSAMEIIPADGVEVSFDDSTSGASTYAIKKTKNLNCSLPVSFGGFSGKVSVSIENPYIDYSISSNKAYVTLNGETTVTYGIYGNLAETAGLSKGFTLFTCNIGGVGSFDVVVNVNFSGSATGTVKGFLTAGVECEKGVGIRAIRNFLQHECYTTVNAETSVSLRASLGATKLPVISAYVYAEVGIRANYSKKTFAGDVTPKECVHFASYLFASYGASASVKFGPISYSESITNEIYSESNSPVRTVFHYEDGMPVAKCSKGTNYSNFFTTASSRRSGCGWMGANGAYGLNADGTPFKLYDYSVSGSNATITKYKGNSAYVSIPETIDGYTVTAIGNSAFKGKNVVNVVIPDTVTSIGYEAFYNCRYLKDLKMSMSVVSLHSGAFENCTSLTGVIIPKTLTNGSWYTLGYGATHNDSTGAFKNCSSLTDVTFEEGCTKVAAGLFANCTGIKNIEIPDTVMVIEEYAFTNAVNLTNLKMSMSVSTIHSGAFENCISLTGVTIPKTLINGSWYTLGYGAAHNDSTGAFKNCSSLTDVTFEEGCTEIAAGLLANCTGLLSVVIPDTVTVIEEYAFYNAVNLTNLKMSMSVQTIYSSAFENCTSLTGVTIPKTLINGSWYTLGYSAAHNDNTGAFKNCSSLTDVTFEDGCTQIAAGLFANCTGIKNIEIPDTVTVIEENAFYNATNLQKVIINDSVTNIGECAFYNCSNLSDLKISMGLTRLWNNAFGNCVSLTSVTIPKTLTDGSWVLTNYGHSSYNNSTGPFYNCSNLSNVTFEEGCTQIAAGLFANCTGIRNIVIPDTVTVIEENAFYNATNLEEVKIPESVTKMENSIFYNCASLKKVNIPNKLIEFGTSIFNNCGFETITLPDNWKEITGATFMNCKNLKNIVIPANIEKIDYNSFANCTTLEQIDFSDGSKLNLIDGSAFNNCSSLKTIHFPKALQTIGAGAFENCSTLENLIFDKDIKLSKILSNAFKNCSSLKEVILPERVTTVQGVTFQNCTALEKVYIPQSTKTLGASAFIGCEKLKDIEIANYSITKIESNTFKDCPAIEKIVLPKGLKTIGSQAFMNCTGLTEVTIPQSVTSIDSTAFSYPSKTTIYGVAGSYAETFANDGGFRFVDIGVESEGLALSDFAEYIVLDRGETYRAEFITFPEETTDIITLTASNSNVTIDGLDITANKTGDALITATASSGITYEFTVHIRDVKNITITTAPTKTEYIIGEKLDTNGMVITVNYNEGTSKTVTDYTVSGFDSSVEGNSTVTVKWVSAYGTTYSAAFNTTITNPIPILEGIYVEKTPFRTKYNRGVQLDLKGLVIMGNYSDGIARPITEYTTSKINILKLGEQTVTVTSGEFTCIFNVTVVNCTSHTEGDWEITIKPTEQTEGEHCKRCTICQTVLTTETIGKLSAGDLNGDGEINIIDLVRLKKIIAGSTTSNGASADVNNDGQTNSIDLNLFKKFLLGIIKEFKN